MPIPGSGGGMTFEEALAAQTDPSRKESLQNLFDQVNAEMKEEKKKTEEGGEEEETENVINLDGEELWRERGKRQYNLSVWEGNEFTTIWVRYSGKGTY